ncbi:exo-alpha-sialidase [Massilia pseudoviolaceinigra]|uniref:exo-alpha-sialidase n=1 Tax=Massilia pseudoviolaceinigra TaxID=3057165 RepID=UPI002796AE6C|nr:exo-alpha-sialidase [Massilia sp. CCM 9206]MDQ1919206.1 exo-alpha-sialidase [Massilia sp. CCM 9206]
MKLIKTMLVLATVLSAASACAQNAAGYKWDIVPMGGAGFVTGVFPAKTEQGMAYARTDVGGAYRWDKGAAKWVPLMDWMPEADMGLMGIESLAVDPKNAANIVLLAGTSYFGNGRTVIMRSTNYGQNFTFTDVTAQFKTHGNGYGRQSGERLAFDPGSSNILYTGTRYNGLFKSTDSGASWTRMNSLNVTTTPNDNGVNLVLPDPTSVVNGVAQRLIVGVSRNSTAGPNLYRSDNGGQTFTAISGPPGKLMPQRGVYDGLGNLYLTYGNGAGPGGLDDPLKESDPMNQGGVWKYDVTNSRWTNVTPSGMTNAFSGISVDPNNRQRVIASTINMYWTQWKSADGKDTYGDRIFLSTNGGTSWTDVVANASKATDGIAWIADESIHWAGSVVFDPFNGQTAWVTSGNGIFKTTNVGAAQPTWTFNVQGLEEAVPLGVVSVPGGPLVSAIGDYDGFRHYNTYTYGQRLTPRMGTTTGLAIAPGNPSIMARVAGKVQYSQNGSVNWAEAPVTNGVQGQVALSANGGVLLHSPKDSSTTWRSLNFGSSWTAVNHLNIKNAFPVGDAVHPNLFYAYDRGNGNFWTSYDGGVNFYAISQLPAWGSDRIRVAPNSGGDVWVPLNGNGLMRSTNSGTSFVKINSVSDCAGIGFGKAATGASYPTIFIWGTVNGTRGLFRSTDTGNTWLRVNDWAHQYGSNGAIVVGDMNTFGVVYMNTAGRGLAVGRP